ncbi:hypothetical protein [Leptospira bandrabouensis]|uniref:Uncharacterized protein n=1 Tax=Leptospira bandrabouensis TaxID=2484903 RepID=A0A6H3NUY3_9LEPT|nr:hypothetical protein [Leptospira bandrabouensis]TGN13318.1 hypothetical protein EHR08_11740 [Leptospira bandrabouensis]
MQTPIALLKFAEIKYLEDSINNNYLFFNKIEYFSNKEKEDYRFDSYEGADEIIQSNQIKKLLINDREFDLAPKSSPVKIFYGNNENFTHICCLSLIYNSAIEIENKQRIFNPKLFEFGDSFLICLKISELLTNIDVICKTHPNIIKWKIDTVEYVDLKNYNGSWDVFHKPENYAYQTELRIALQMNIASTFKFNIPNLDTYFFKTIKKENCKNKIENGTAYF